MNATAFTYTFRKDADGFVEIFEMENGVWMLWDARFPTQAEADAAVATSKRRRQCKMVWGLAA